MQCLFLFLLFLRLQRVVSSVGLEHYLDRVGVTGSTPVQPTTKNRRFIETAGFLLILILVDVILSHKEFKQKQNGQNYSHYCNIFEFTC